FPDVKAGLTGAPVLGNDEMEAAFRDSKRAAALAFVLTLGVLTVAFRRFGMPILVLGTLAVSVCWSLGVVTLVVGHLSIFSIMFAWLSMMTLLPALVLLTGRGRVERRRETGPQAVRLVARITRHPRLGVGLAAVAAALSLVALCGVRFDYNLLHLQARGTES